MGIPQTAAAKEALALSRSRPLGAAEREAAVARFVALAMAMSIGECIDVGFDFHDADDDAGAMEIVRWFGDGESQGMLRLDLSPDRSHRALFWSASRPERAHRLWIDGRERLLPTFGNDRLVVESPGLWNDRRFFVVRLVVPDHPLQDWSGRPGTGQGGLFIVDADVGRDRVVQPRDDESWTHPLLRLDGARLRVYADRAALDAGTVAREIELA
jgi:hypothetical protein